MLIRVVTTQADIPRTGEGIASRPRRDRAEGSPRWTGTAASRWRWTDSSRRYVGIAAWTDAAALAASEHDAPALIADLARRLHGSTPSVEVFDLVLAHVVKPVRVGYWGRRARLEVPVSDLARAERKLEQMLLAIFDRYQGLAGIVLFVDHTSGVLENIIWYDSLGALKGSATRAEKCDSCSPQTYRQRVTSSFPRWKSSSRKCEGCSSTDLSSPVDGD